MANSDIRRSLIDPKIIGLTIIALILLIAGLCGAILERML
jgi:hypothetical protein